MINWQSFSWEAFAALVTGLSAVIGATLVGLRQAKILDRQAKFGRLSYNHALFERRLAIFEAREALIFQGLDLNQRFHEDAEPGVRERFIRAHKEARWILGPSVHKDMQKILDTYLRYFHIAERWRGREKTVFDHAEEKALRKILAEKAKDLPVEFEQALRLDETLDVGRYVPTPLGPEFYTHRFQRVWHRQMERAFGTLQEQAAKAGIKTSASDTSAKPD